MNLQMLYELKARLEHAAIAGTGLLHEDFRFKRAAEGLAPLAAASPVFSKIHAAAMALPDTTMETRSAALLDLLSLVNAVVYTQGVTDVPGEMRARQPGCGRYVQTAYSQLQPLIAALTETGSGRMAIIERCWKEERALFADFRVLPHVVDALDDSYGERADLAATILLHQGTEIVPLLKAGFELTGKRGMVRRVQLIAEVAGEAENEWFVHLLPESKKEIREAVILALGENQQNAQLLLDLCQSERGKAREAALRALARMDAPECVIYWEKEAKQKPETVCLLDGIDTPLAADLAARALRLALEAQLERGMFEDVEQLKGFMQLVCTACGKHSPELDAVWRWIAQNMEAIDRLGLNSSIRQNGMVIQGNLSMAELMQLTLMKTVCLKPSPSVLSLARDLAKGCEKWFLCGAMLADLIEADPGEVYDRYAPMIVCESLLHKENAGEKNRRIQILRALSTVRWEEETGQYVLTFFHEHRARRLPIPGIDPRWLLLFADEKVKDGGETVDFTVSGAGLRSRVTIETILTGLLRPDDAQGCAAVGAYLYRQVQKNGLLAEHMDALLRCGWKDWKGLLTHCVRVSGRLRDGEMLDILMRMPISHQDKAQELRELDALIRSEGEKIRCGVWHEDKVKAMIEVYEAGILR